MTAKKETAAMIRQSGHTATDCFMQNMRSDGAQMQPSLLAHTLSENQVPGTRIVYLLMGLPPTMAAFRRDAALMCIQLTE